MQKVRKSSETGLKQSLLNKIKEKKATVCVIGLGYVGLPLTRAFWQAGQRVIGFDIDSNKVNSLNSGKSYIMSVNTETVGKMRKSGKFEATSDPKRIGEADVVIICVPTPLTEDGRPDLSYIVNTGKIIAQSLKKGMLVSLESTTYPGTTREVLAPELEESGLKASKDFFLCFSPEREDPGNPNYTISNIPKIVGGIDPDSQEAAVALYSSVTKVVPVSSADVAEACKILENTYRAVNIALINELKMLFDRMDINVWEVIAGSSTKPFGFQPFFPGPGWGGHCIPLDPFYLSWRAQRFDVNTMFIDFAGLVNTRMPNYVANKLESALKRQGKKIRGAKILLLGIAYKKDCDDARESPAFRVMEILDERGAKFEYSDPHIPVAPKTRRFNYHLKSVPISEKSLASFDAAVIVANHSTFDYDFIVKHSRIVVDTRNATASVKTGREKIVSA